MAADSLPVYVEQDGADVLLAVHVQPKAKQTSWAGLYGERVKIRLAAPPVDGRANAALCDWLAVQFDCAPRDVTVEKGLASRTKLVRVCGASAMNISMLVDA